MSLDVQDILGVGQQNERLGISKEQFFDDKKKKPKPSTYFKKPEGITRELWGLIKTDDKETPPVIPTVTSALEFRKPKVKLSNLKVRPWKWMAFTNPARTDGAVLCHWRRASDQGKEYPFAKFNKQLELPTYTDAEYDEYLKCDTWSREETDYLMGLCGQFDLRFVIIQDRYDSAGRYPRRSVEDMKERYYQIHNWFVKHKSSSLAHNPTVWKTVVYDAEHERKRKEQLAKLFGRTEEQLDEEQMLINELRKIELRKRERERRQKDLQKLLSTADTVQRQGRPEGSVGRPRLKAAHPPADGATAQQRRKAAAMMPAVAAASVGATDVDSAIRFADIRQPGILLRSSLMKLPPSLNQKRTKIIEEMVDELHLDTCTAGSGGAEIMACSELVDKFNQLRQDLLLLHDLRQAYTGQLFELQALKHRLQQRGAVDQLAEIDNALASFAASTANTLAGVALTPSRQSGPSVMATTSAPVIAASGGVGRKRRIGSTASPSTKVISVPPTMTSPSAPKKLKHSMSALASTK